MNIFYLDTNPSQIAKWLVNSHVVKMPLESAQMLSTAHRMLDGKKQEVSFVDEKGKARVKILHVLPEEKIQTITLPDGKIRPVTVHASGVICYSAAHAQHPSSVWTRASKSQYDWHYALARAMLNEYTFRYRRLHSVESIMPFLKNSPKNIPSAEWTPPPLAMPDVYKDHEHVASYRRYYAGDKWRFAKWKSNEIPHWYLDTLGAVWRDDKYQERLDFVQVVMNKKTKPMHEDVLKKALALS